MNNNAFVASDEDYTFIEEEWDEFLFETRPDDFGNHHCSAWTEMPSDEVYYSESDEKNAEEYFAQQEEDKQRKQEPADEDAEDDENDEDDRECFHKEFDHERSLRAGVARHRHKSFDCDW